MSLKEQIDLTKLPKHVAIIMDGNGRWAKKRMLPRIIGHTNGVKTVKKIVEFARKLNIQVLTLYAFSTENWQRPKDEVSGIMTLLKTYLKSELEKIDGLMIMDTFTHYMLVNVEWTTSLELKNWLMTHHGILIRDASNFHGLDIHCFRVAAQSPEENDALIAAIKEFKSTR